MMLNLPRVTRSISLLVRIFICFAWHESQLCLCSGSNVDSPPDEQSVYMLQRQYNEAGYHRTILTSLSIDENYDSRFTHAEPQIPEILLIQHLPAGMYVDPYQLADLEPFGGPKVLTQTPIDVEKPEHLSESQDIYIFPRCTAAFDGRFHVNVTMPVHLRYHKASPHLDHAMVMFPPPKVFVEFSGSVDSVVSSVIDAPCHIEELGLCKWMELICTETDHSTLQFRVPVGEEGHIQMIVMVTTLTSLAASFFLSKSIISNRPRVRFT